MPGILVRGVSEETARALRLQAKYGGVSSRIWRARPAARGTSSNGSE
jgi:hypothetical protein